jgi:hypothetical protein
MPLCTHVVAPSEAAGLALHAGASRPAGRHRLQCASDGAGQQPHHSSDAAFVKFCSDCEASAFFTKLHAQGVPICIKTGYCSTQQLREHLAADRSPLGCGGGKGAGTLSSRTQKVRLFSIRLTLQANEV